jgi:hypothetical protein
LGGCPLLHGYRVPAGPKSHRSEVRLRAPPIPDVRLRARPEYATGWRRALHSRQALRPALASDRLQPRFHGPGAGRLSPPGTSRRDSSRRELRPNPIGSDTSCRELVAPPAGRASDAGSRRTCWRHGSPVRLRAHLASPLSRCPPQPPGRPARAGPPGLGKPLAQPFHQLGWVLACADTIRGQGPPHPILREEDRDPLHPRCLPSMSCPVRGRTFSTACLQPVENLRRLCDLRPPLPSLTGRQAARTRALLQNQPEGRP